MTRTDCDWYRDGLRFECTRCGRCCTGSGTVRVDAQEQRALARRLGLTLEDFLERYTRRLPDGELSLTEKSNADCVFWDSEQGCSVYQDRPRQCRSWPFWRGNIASRAHWESAAGHCPGMDQGPLHGAPEIRATAARDGTSGIIPDLIEWS